MSSGKAAVGVENKSGVSNEERGDEDGIGLGLGCEGDSSRTSVDVGAGVGVGVGVGVGDDAPLRRDISGSGLCEAVRELRRAQRLKAFRNTSIIRL
jgi:hypothetical protein